MLARREPFDTITTGAGDQCAQTRAVRPQGSPQLYSLAHPPSPVCADRQRGDALALRIRYVAAYSPLGLRGHVSDRRALPLQGRATMQVHEPTPNPAAQPTCLLPAHMFTSLLCFFAGLLRERLRRAYWCPRERVSAGALVRLYVYRILALHTHVCMCVRTRACACVLACVRVCVRECVRGCMCVRVCGM